MSVITICLAFGAYFASIVLTPLWLQIYMGYTATQSGLTTAALGILSFVAAPIVAKLLPRFDLRYMVMFGVSWLGLWTFVRSFNTTDMTSAQIAWPMLLQGIGMPLFFVPLTRLALVSVRPEETASAAGLMSFSRTLAGAFATSIITTAWDDQTQIFRTDLVERIGSFAIPADSVITSEMAPSLLNNLVQSQAVMLATNHIFMIVSATFVFAAIAIGFAKNTKISAE
jgi:DHA2 family multidrug resistance protein